MKTEMLYAVFVRFNGNTDNARSGNAGFDLTLREEIMVFNTKYILYNIMDYKPEDETVEERLTRQHNTFVGYRNGVDGNGLSEQGHAILFELRYCLTGKCENTMKIGKL